MAYPGQPGGYGPQNAQGYGQSHGQPGHAQPGPQGAAPNALAAHPMSGLQITTSFIFLQWFLYFKRPMLELNNYPYPLSWGTETVPIPPGQYNMRIYVPGLFFPHFDTHAPLTIYPNTVTGVTWSTAFFIFMSGDLRELGYKPWGS